MHRLPARLFFLTLAMLMLAGCTRGDGVRERVFPPTASIQELVQREGGSWTLRLRLQNFSNVGMRMDALQAQLRLAGSDAGGVTLQPGVIVPPQSAEVVETTLVVSAATAAAVRAALDAGRSVPYALEGSIRSSEPRRRNDEFTFESQLNAVPGLAGVLR
jgi:hypothetical protein